MFIILNSKHKRTKLCICNGNIIQKSHIIWMIVKLTSSFSHSLQLETILKHNTHKNNTQIPTSIIGIIGLDRCEFDVDKVLNYFGITTLKSKMLGGGHYKYIKNYNVKILWCPKCAYFKNGVDIETLFYQCSKCNKVMDVKNHFSLLHLKNSDQIKLYHKFLKKIIVTIDKSYFDKSAMDNYSFLLKQDIVDKNKIIPLSVSCFDNESVKLFNKIYPNVNQPVQRLNDTFMTYLSKLSNHHIQSMVYKPFKFITLCSSDPNDYDCWSIDVKGAKLLIIVKDGVLKKKDFNKLTFTTMQTKWGVNNKMWFKPVCFKITGIDIGHDSQIDVDCIWGNCVVEISTTLDPSLKIRNF